MYLILGKQGQLGQALIQTLQTYGIPFAAPEEKDADILDLSCLQSLAEKHKAEVLINCAAYTDVEKAESDEETASAVNILGPKNIGAVCARLGITGVHFSTDYVFSGDTNQPYHEEDTPVPLNVYGRTKLEGEQTFLESGAKGLVLRTSWLYSSLGRNFYATMRRLGRKESVVNVVYDQVGTPTYAPHLAEYVVQILNKFEPCHTGIYHLGDEGTASWYDLAYAVMNRENLPCRVNPVGSHEYPVKAKRPFYSVLSKDKVKKTFNLVLSHWTEGVSSCRQAFEKISW